MKALFVAPDLTVLAQMLSVSASKKNLIENVNNLVESDNYKDRIKAITRNPSNLRFAWIRFDKNEDNLDFFTSLLLLSANNNYSTSTKDLIMTQDSTFVNVNLMDAYKNVANGPDDSIDLDLQDKVSKEKIVSLCNDMFDEPQFIELHSSEAGPQMFMLSATFSVDTWDMLSTIGTVSHRSFALSTGDSTEKIPGFCVMFGLSMTTLLHIEANAEKMPKHIEEDLKSLPKAQKSE